MAVTPPILPTPYKMAVVGLVMTEKSPGKRAEIEQAVRNALDSLEGVEVHQSFFMWDNVEIRVVPNDGQ